MGFAGTAQADEFADAVESFTPPTGCKTTTAAGNGNDCDISGDDGDNGTDALGPDDGAAGNDTTFTSLGFTNDFDNNGGNGLQPLGGVLILTFTDNFCVDGLNPDFTVFEVGAGEGGVDEDYDVTVGPGAGTAAGSGTGDTNFNSPVNAFNRITITATDGEETNPTGGPDIDAVECLASFEFTDIEKDFADHPGDPDSEDEIDQTSPGGPDIQQFKAFTITITNNTGVDGGLAGLTFIDVVAAEFDLDPDPDAQGDGGDQDGVEVTDADGALTDCTATGAEGGAKGKGKGNQKLAPDVVTMTAGGLDDGDSCEVTVWVTTDDDHPGKGNNPTWTPTSCPITLNDGVKVFDASMNLLLQDDDSLVFDDNDPVSEGVCNEAADD